MLYDFQKLQSLGNDFVLLDLRTQQTAPSMDALKHLAHRRLGAGCDQVLLLQAPTDAEAHVDCRIYNTDGSEAEHCGNGMRCIALYLMRYGGYAEARHLTVRIPAGCVQIVPLDEGRFRVEMGVPELHTPEAGGTCTLNGHTYTFTALSIGNPHAVFEVANVHPFPLEELGAAMQTHPMFPHGVNVSVMAPGAPGSVLLRIYERGSGETMACGSGACAAAIAGRYNEGISDGVELAMPGGVLQVHWDGPGTPVYLTGPAEHVFAGRIEL